MSFQSLGLAPELLRVLTECGYEVPTPIQQQAIPAVLTGQDMIACAQTGTGKTAAFTLPLLHRLGQLRNENGRTASILRVLVLTPTRELALQVGESITTYGKYLKLRSAVIYGGVNINNQISQLRNGVDLLVATPGRLLDHMQQGTVDLNDINVLVLDEADRMLDMGFIRDVRRIIAALPKKRQNLLFSATFSPEIKDLAYELLKNPTIIEVAKRTAAADLVEQCVYRIERTQKRALLSHLIKEGDWQQVLVFTRTKHGANRLAKQLTQDGHSATAIHGNKSQAARVLALRQFKEGSVKILVATDIAARGIDISQLPFVVNFDLPNVPEDYVHRIGRTGRAGCDGKAVSLVSSDEDKLLEAIERVLKARVPMQPVPEFTRAVVTLSQQEDDQGEPRSRQQGQQNRRRQPEGAGRGQGRGHERHAERGQANRGRSSLHHPGEQQRRPRPHGQDNQAASAQTSSQRQDQQRGNQQRSHQERNHNQQRQNQARRPHPRDEQQLEERQGRNPQQSDQQEHKAERRPRAEHERGRGQRRSARNEGGNQADRPAGERAASRRRGPRSDDNNAPSNGRPANQQRGQRPGERSSSQPPSRLRSFLKKAIERPYDDEDDDDQGTKNSKSTTVQAPAPRKRWFFL